MPITPEKKHLYSRDWSHVIRPAILRRAQHRCERCGVKNYDRGWWLRGAWVSSTETTLVPPKLASLLLKELGKRPQGVRVVLTIAHMDHDPGNNDTGNLRAMCQRCHLTYDAEHHAKNAAETRKKKRCLP